MSLSLQSRSPFQAVSRYAVLLRRRSAPHRTLSLAVFWVGYSRFAEAGSILFLLLQAFILVDFAYTLHEWLIARMDAADERMHGMDWEPGMLSNGWKIACE